MKKRTTEQPPEPAAEIIHHPGLSGIPRPTMNQPPAPAPAPVDDAVDPEPGADTAAEDQ